jgi:DNA adenine methylase
MTGPLSYIGGKHRLAKQIIAMFPEHTTYVEPFAGGAQVFFRKRPSPVEVLNDIDDEIVNFFRVCQNHYQEFLRYTRHMLVSRKWFDILSRTNPGGLTDVQRAARFFYLQKNAFAGRVYRQNFAVHVIQPPRFHTRAVADVIEKTHERLLGVQIESAPYEEVLRRFDRPTTLFYLDPPYYDKQLYRFNFERDDFRLLAMRLAALKGKFVLSLNDVPEVRELFAAFEILSVTLAYSAQKNRGNRYSELIIKNY